MKQITVYKGRTNTIPVSAGIDLSGDTIVSEIRSKRDVGSDLIATWSVSFLNDGTDGELILTLDDSVTEDITHSVGYMDIKRVTVGEPRNLFDEIIEVLFKTTVTE